MSTLTQKLLTAMTWRCIGPPRGGRVIAVHGDLANPAVYYFGAVAGGLWKTTDAGVTWENVSDGFFKTASVGALAVSPSHANVIYVGMGESTIRTDVSHGDGVYKSLDAGKTWIHCGLAATRHISKVRIHPTNPDLVYVAALGHAFGPNAERGVYRSKDGGKSWEQVLFKSDKAGAIDLTFDPNNPDILYASLWQVYRNFWELSSGGPDSGIWKSTDGGDTWKDISANTGLPAGIKGKIGLSASPARAGRVWAVIEAKESGFFRSDDYGTTWQKLTDRAELRQRPFYYMHVHADPVDPDTVYVNNLAFQKSSDGGTTWVEISTPHGDNHDLWIDPRNNQRMIQGNDGGANISFNGGASFSSIYNQLTGQFYNIAADNQFPYRVYATQQDNSSISVPSNSADGAISWGDCFAAGTGESGFITVHPDDPNIVYVGAVGSSPGGGGALQRYDHRTGHIQLVNVWPEPHGAIGPGQLKYRFPWTFPILFSPHDSRVLYSTGNCVFRSTDEGMSWEPISPDLTRADMSKLGPSGGPLTLDTSAAEHYCCIATLRESPHEKGVLWSGSDDGLVYRSADNGKNWVDVTPNQLPEWSFVRTLEPSPFDPATFYLAATRYKLDDPTPYLYKTTDDGQSWSLITNGLPADDYTRVIRADPTHRGLLYCGTETGVYVSLDDGASWQRWGGNLPITPVYDLLVKENDLIAGTHGRGFWVLDDLTPLYQLLENASTLAAAAVHLFAPRRAWRMLPDLFAGWYGLGEGRHYGTGLGKAANIVVKKDDNGHLLINVLDGGNAAPPGVVVNYYLVEQPTAETKLFMSFLDENGNLLREYKPKPAGYDKLDDKAKSVDPGPWLPTKAGMNRLVWDLRYVGATRLASNKTADEANIGPLVLPGSYQVRLTVGNAGGDVVQTASFTVVNDPRVKTALADLKKQQQLWLQIRDKISQLYGGVQKLRDVQGQVKGWAERLAKLAGNEAVGNDAVVQAANELAGKLAAIEDKLILPGEQKNTYDLVVPQRLNNKLSSLLPIIGSADRAPTKQARTLASQYMAQIDEQLAALELLFKNDLKALNAQIAKSKVPAIVA